MSLDQGQTVSRERRVLLSTERHEAREDPTPRYGTDPIALQPTLFRLTYRPRYVLTYVHDETCRQESSLVRVCSR
jgi:hypothetical protein